MDFPCTICRKPCFYMWYVPSVPPDRGSGKVSPKPSSGLDDYLIVYMMCTSKKLTPPTIRVKLGYPQKMVHTKNRHSNLRSRSRSLSYHVSPPALSWTPHPLSSQSVAGSVMEIISEFFCVCHIFGTSWKHRHWLKTPWKHHIRWNWGTYIGTVLKSSRELLKAKSFPSAQIWVTQFLETFKGTYRGKISLQERENPSQGLHLVVDVTGFPSCLSGTRMNHRFGAISMAHSDWRFNVLHSPQSSHNVNPGVCKTTCYKNEKLVLYSPH